MTPESLRGFLQGGMLVTVASLGLVLATPRDSAEFVVSVCSLGTGLTLVGFIVLIMWFNKR